MRRLAVALLGSLLACGAAAKVGDLVAEGPSRTLRTRPAGAPTRSLGHPPLLVIAFDGVDRALLYGMLKQGELPALSALLGGGGEAAKHPHAYLDEHLLTTLPSSTMAAWTTAMTGVPPSEHGITGNEFFIREDRRLGAPAPVGFHDAKPTLAIYTDGYLDALKDAPSVYDRMREREPNVLVWVAMHQVFSGADRLLVTKPTILARAFEQVVEAPLKATATKNKGRDAYQALDEQVASVVVDALASGPVPDVLTVYFSGTDLYAHIAEEGPDIARRGYLREIVEPAIAKLTAQLWTRGALDDRYVVVTADHGHTAVVHDDAHALDTRGPDDPPALMKKAGYTVRPFQVDVPATTDFDAVITPGGAMAYVYLADRSKAPRDWRAPPRYEEDVLPMAEAFFQNDVDGKLVPEMKGVLDLVLTRRPKPYAEVDLPFEVYVGGGRTVPVAEYLRSHPHPTYVDVDARLRDLAAGRHGERAGDVLLLAHDGDRDDPQQRFYFAAPYRSWHGSPSRQDSEIPLIVAHPRHSSAELGARVAAVLGDRPYQQRVTDLLLALRAGKD